MEKIINRIQDNLKETINQLETLKKQEMEENIKQICDRLDKVEETLKIVKGAII